MTLICYYKFWEAELINEELMKEKDNHKLYYVE